MSPLEHQAYANELLLSLGGNGSISGSLAYIPDRGKKRNTATAITLILRERVAKNSIAQPTSHQEDRSFNWNGGVYNCRNITDRVEMWTNLRRKVADKHHQIAAAQPVAYLLSSCRPADRALFVWAVPEPVLYECLLRLPSKKSKRPGEDEYTIEINAENQRVQGDIVSPDLSPYFRRLILEDAEFDVLHRSREADEYAKAYERRDSPAEVSKDFRKIEIADVPETTKTELKKARLGQGKFRKQVLNCWRCRCAVTGSTTTDAIRASHIKPWRASTNEERLDPRNGIPLVASLDALFDAGLITFDAFGRLLASPQLPAEERLIFALSEQALAKAPHQKTVEYLLYHRRECFQNE